MAYHGNTNKFARMIQDNSVDSQYVFTCYISSPVILGGFSLNFSHMPSFARSTEALCPDQRDFGIVHAGVAEFAAKDVHVCLGGLRLCPETCDVRACRDDRKRAGRGACVEKMFLDIYMSSKPVRSTNSIANLELTGACLRNTPRAGVGGCPTAIAVL